MDVFLQFLSYIKRRFGWRITIAVCLLSLILIVFFLRDQLIQTTTELGAWKYVQPFIPTPKTKSTSFTIIIARFGNDSSDEYQRGFQRELGQLAGIEVMTTAKLVSFEKTVDATICHPAARTMLLESGADIVLWGNVIKQGMQSVPQTFLTSKTDCGTSQRVARYVFTERLELPSLAFQDLIGVVKSQVVAESDTLLDKRVPTPSSEIAISKIRQLLSQDDQRRHLAPQERLDLWLTLSDIEALSLIFAPPPVSIEKLELAEATHVEILNRFAVEMKARNRAVVSFHLAQLMRIRAQQTDNGVVLALAREHLLDAERFARETTDKPLVEMILQDHMLASPPTPFARIFTRARYEVFVLAQRRLEAALELGVAGQIADAKARHCMAAVDYYLLTRDFTRSRRQVSECIGLLGDENLKLAEVDSARILAAAGRGIVYTASMRNETWLARLSSIAAMGIEKSIHLQSNSGADYFREFDVYAKLERANGASGSALDPAVLATARQIFNGHSANLDSQAKGRRMRLLADALARSDVILSSSEAASNCETAKTLYKQIRESPVRLEMYPSRRLPSAGADRCGGL